MSITDLSKKQHRQDTNNSKFNMSILEHLEELRARTIKSILLFIVLSCLSLHYINYISSLLTKPALGIKFLQLGPGEYFFSTIKISIYTGIILSSPFIIYQTLLFILPGLTKKETQLIVPLLIFSIALFFIGIFFAYIILMPTALQFFINYGSDIVEPLWSFEQYFEFTTILLITTGFAFQLPIIQIIIGLFNIVSSAKMLQWWRYIILLATMISAILTPSTDPITQLCLSLAIISLYFTGALVLKLVNK